MKAQKKPVTVDVWKLPDNLDGVKSLKKMLPMEIRTRFSFIPKLNEYHIKSLEGEMVAHPHDYLVYGGHDDVWSVKQAIFEDTYTITDKLG